ncbi:MAG: orotate phosphoribosyltransferase [Kiritimatiellia bacterium]
MLTSNDVLKIFRDSEALLEGHFELRSKLHSPNFFQCAMVLRFPRLADQLCSALVETMRAAHAVDAIDGVIAPAMGGLVVGHEVARALNVKSIFAEKQDDKLVLRRGFKIKPGDRYVVAEDVVTRGGRVQETIDIVTGLGGVVAAVAVLVDRSAGKASFPAPTFSLLKLAPVTYEPAACPLCAKGMPLAHPGS